MMFFRRNLTILLLLCVSTLAPAMALTTPLSPEQAFRFHVKPLAHGALDITLTLGKHVFLYPEHSKWMLPSKTLKNIEITTIHPKKDSPTHWSRWVRWHMQPKGKTPLPKHLTLHYQGCSETGYCYAPSAHRFNLLAYNHYPINEAQAALSQSKTDRTIKHTPHQASHPTGISLFSWHAAWIYFMLGIMMIASPCVWPLLPILWANTLKEAKNASDKTAMIGAFLLGVLLSYALLGVVFGQIGGLITTQLQSAQVSAVMALMLLLMAGITVDKIRWPFSGATIFGLALPSTAGKWRYARLLVLGGSSSLILSPCATPALVSGLMLTTQHGMASFGVLYLSIMGLGVTMPMGVIAWFGQHLSLKSGPWLLGIKRLLAWILVALAAHIVLPWVSPWAHQTTAGIMMAVLLSLWLMAFIATLRQADDSWPKRALLIAVYLLAMVVMAQYNGLLSTLKHDQYLGPHKPSITHTATLDNVLAQAKQRHQKVFIDFSAAWCSACRTLEGTLWTQTSVTQALKGIRWLRVDLTQPNAAMQSWMGHHGLIAPPAFLLMDPNHKPAVLWAHTGWIKANAFLSTIKRLKPS
jgi:thioredoxin:protein disulfide reductase